MRVGRRRWQIVVGLALIAGTGFAVASLPHERLLLQQATYIANTGSWLNIWEPGRTMPFYMSRCEWLSGHQALFFRTKNPDAHSCQAFQYDTRTHTEQPLPAFDSRLRDSMSVIPVYQGRTSSSPGRLLTSELMNDWHLSPDGRYVLKYPGGAACAVALDGSRQISLPKTGIAVWSQRSAWQPDSHGLVGLRHEGNGVQAILLSLDDPHQVVSIPLKRLGDDLIAGVTRDGRLITQRFHLWPASRLSFTVFDLHTSPAIGKRVTATFPAGTQITEFRLSPDGTHLLWSGWTPSGPPGPPLLQRILALLGYRPRLVAGLWVSRLDGSELRQIGHLAHTPPLRPIVRGFPPPQPPIPHGLRWLPDGRHVSFIYQDGLYTVPAD